MTFFAEVSPLWESIPMDDSGFIGTIPFLDACGSLNKLFDRMGVAMKLVKSDINGNIGKLRASHAKQAEGCETLQTMVQAEMKAGSIRTSGANCESLLWLKRALEFIMHLLDQLSQDSKAEFSVCMLPTHPNITQAIVYTAYERALKPYHGWIVQKTFGVATSAAGTRDSFMKLLGPDEETVLREMKQFLERYHVVVGALMKFYDDNDLDDKRKV